MNKRKKKEIKQIPQIILDDLLWLKTYKIVKSCIIASNRMNDINGIEALAADITNDLLEYENK